MKRTSNRKMTPSTSKKVKPSTSKKMEPPTSQTDSTLLDVESPDEKLILYANPKTYELEVSSTSKGKQVPDLGVLKLEEFINEMWFQDNTLLFEKLLTSKKDFILCVFPPGSGKSTIAELLRFYLSKDRAPESIEKWFYHCNFHKAEDDRAQVDTSYQKFRSSSSFVLSIDFSKIEGETRSELEKSYVDYVVVDCWKNAGLPAEKLNAEEKLLLEQPTAIWSSLGRLRSIIHGTVGGHSYIILDTLDNMYNLIANLPSAESTVLYAKFTKDITKLIDKRDPNSKIRTFCFGVSPYLITEFQTRVFYSIVDTDNEVSQYFSFSDASIEKIIREWKLDVTKDQCKSVARFQYDQNTFINPYLCLSYLKSLHDKSMYAVNISPRSLWLSCIFQEEDLKILLRILSSTPREHNCKFKMDVNMGTMCTIPQSSKTRVLYYPLFVYGGYLSCHEEEDESYTLTIANKTTKELLKYHANTLLFRKLKFPVTIVVLDAFLKEDYNLFCAKISEYSACLSSKLLTGELNKHNHLAGILNLLKDLGYEVEHDKEIGGVKPDSYICNDRRLILHEYKSIKPNKPSKNDSSTLQSRVVNMCISTVKKTCAKQIDKYKATAVAKSKQNVDICVNLLLFYDIHVILLNSKYCRTTCIFSPYRIFASQGFFEEKDLESIRKESTFTK